MSDGRGLVSDVVIHHVRHRVAVGWPGKRVWQTVCGERFVSALYSSRDTRFHEPAFSRCDGCYGRPAVAA